MKGIGVGWGGVGGKQLHIFLRCFSRLAWGREGETDSSSTQLRGFSWPGENKKSRLSRQRTRCANLTRKKRHTRKTGMYILRHSGGDEATRKNTEKVRCTRRVQTAANWEEVGCCCERGSAYVDNRHRDEYNRMRSVFVSHQVNESTNSKSRTFFSPLDAGATFCE